MSIPLLLFVSRWTEASVVRHTTQNGAMVADATQGKLDGWCAVLTELSRKKTTIRRGLARPRKSRCLANKAGGCGRPFLLMSACGHAHLSTGRLANGITHTLLMTIGPLLREGPMFVRNQRINFSGAVCAQSRHRRLLRQRHPRHAKLSNLT